MTQLSEINQPIDQKSQRLPFWFWLILGAMVVYAAVMATAGFTIMLAWHDESPIDVSWAWLIIFIGGVIPWSLSRK